MVFSSKDGADKIVLDAHRAGIHVNAIHGNKSQRSAAGDRFVRSGEIKVLV